jgi:hypothetical protein
MDTLGTLHQPPRNWPGGLLERIARGETVGAGDVAQLAAEVVANPPPLVAAAQRFLRVLGSAPDGAAAVAFLELLSRERDAPIIHRADATTE